MFLELSEVFVCPSCRPAQGLIVLVEAIDERRVRRGHLGCPECELRVPIREGVIRFHRSRGDESDDEGGGGHEGRGRGPGADARAAGSGGTVDGVALLDGVDDDEGATRLAALLGAREAEGCLLLGPGLERLAVPLAPLAPDAEVLALVGDDAPTDGEDPADAGDATSGRGGVSRAVGVDPGDLPLVTGRVAGAALLRPPEEAVGEAVRVLREGARIVLLEPSGEALDALETQPVRRAAAGEGAVVAVRRPGPAPEPS